MEKFLRESGFPIFGGKFYAASLNLVFGRHFETVSIFGFVALFSNKVLLGYFISGVHFSAKKKSFWKVLF